MSSSPEKRKQTAMVGEATTHNPSFVTKVPWYLGKAEDKKDDKGTAVLDHQKNWKPAASSSLTAVVPDQKSSSTSSANHRMDSSIVCENCGNKGHVRRDCLERPRKILAKYSEEEELGHEVGEVDQVLAHTGDRSGGFEAKRDRWEGFQAEDYTKVVEDFELEEIRQKIGSSKTDEKKNKFAADETVANLRMRNDTAKYLYNLDVNSAFYDPKSRSMRDDPRAGTAAGEYKGDNFVRFSGDVAESMKIRQFAWDSAQQDKGTKIHEIANPTESVMILKKTEKKEKDKISEQQRAILQKYGALNDSSDDSD